MAKRLEESLYRSAKSFDEYNDASTLKQRLQQLAHNIGMKTKRIQQAQMQARAQQQQQPQQQQQMGQQGVQYRTVPQQQQQQQGVPQQQPIAPLQQQQQQAPVQQLQQAPIAQRQHQPMQQPPPVQQPQGNNSRIVNVAEINPIMSQPSAKPTHAPVQPAPIQYLAQPQAPVAAQPQQAPGSVQAPPPPQNGRTPAGAGSGNRQVSDRQQVLRHQQQRLLLLRHAAKCQHDDGRCPVTPHCAGMKRLWKHIAECKDQKCLVPHCVSSRYVLSHYHRCKDVRCPVCGPVREAIHRSHEKQKQMQALKQRHQQAVQQNQNEEKIPAGAALAPPPVQHQVQSQAPIASQGGIPIQQQQQQPMQQQQHQPLHQQPLQYPPQPNATMSALPGEPPSKRQRTSGVPMTYQQQPVAPAPGQPIAPRNMYQPPPVAAPPPGGPQPISSQPPTVKQGFGYPSKPQPMSQQPGVPSTASVPPKITVPPIAGVKFANGQVITPKFTGPKPQEDHTLINCFSVEQIETHIKSLNKGLQLPPLKLKVKCLEVLKVLQGHQHGWVFNSPVDPIELGLPDYFEVIKIPMDLGTIRKKLENGCYHSLDSFHTHVHTTFDNAMLYNPEGSVVYNMANEMKTKFKQDFEILMKQLNADEDVKRRNGEACSLCGCEKLLFEPPVFYCNGLSCPSKRIRRNSYYYVGGNNQYHWCHQCFQELKDNQLLELADVSIRKEQLTKKKNDETHEESWVQCDRCERWVHQICALFNTRQNKDQRSEFACPRCTIEERKKTGRLEATSSTPMAEDLQRTKLSEYVETHVRVKMAEHLKELAEEKVLKEGMDLEEAKASVTMGGTITIRQVTSMDRKLEVRERMKKRYAFKNYPDEFTYRCKCFVVFQNLDGVDVILFGLYVYEHDEKNPAPNQRAVYVSYLDSVHYMRPRSMRTFIYHEILISYLDYVRRRGFSTAHIWACPPLKGDDYILYAKPEDQKTPKDDRLRQWYIDMLIDCQKRGIVGRLTNMYDLYFSSKENNATIVPYMEGDYFPAEVENIIKDIEEGKVGKKTGGKEGKKKKGDKKQKKKGGRGGTRSSGIDEDALKASGIQFPGKDQKSLEEGGRDYVMVKLGETIQPMKESFIVAHLAWKGAKKENMVVPRAIQEYREKHNIKIEDGPDDDFDSEENIEEKSDGKTSDTSQKESNGKNKDAVVGVVDGEQPEKVETKEVAVKVEDTEMKDAEKSDGTVMKETSDDTVMKDAEKINGGEKSEDAAITKDAEKSVDVNAKDAEKSMDDNAKDAEKFTDDNVKESKDTEKPKGANTEDVVVNSEDTDMMDTDESKDSSKADAVEGDKSDKLDESAKDDNAEKTDPATEKGNTEEKTSQENNEAVEDANSSSTDENIKKESNVAAVANTDDKSEKKTADGKSEKKTEDNKSEKKTDDDKSEMKMNDGKSEKKTDDASAASTNGDKNEEKKTGDAAAASTNGDKNEEEKSDDAAAASTNGDKNEEEKTDDAAAASTNGDKNEEKKTDDAAAASTNGDKNEEKKADDTTDAKADQVEVQPDTPAADTKLVEGKNDTIPATPGITEIDAASKAAAENKAASSNNTDAVGETVGDESVSTSTSEKGEGAKPTLSMVERSGKFASMAKKRGLPAEVQSENDEKSMEKEKEKETEAEPAPVIYVLDSKGRRVKVIDDDAEEMDCEFLNNRQAFLNLCQGNHYQYDHLRRAKHSSMMVLWHLHNRDAPKFVQQCTTCSREILQGYRFHCPICADFDQCQDCVQNPNTPRHPHQLKPIAVAGQQTELTEAQRKERQRSIQLHMTLLQHAATCNSTKCPSANCTKMKGLLKHGSQCTVKATGGCNVCKRIWALLQIHARQCKAQQCPVPNCMAIRERVRQLKKQQQAMDDRRRQEMNRVYRGAR